MDSRINLEIYPLAENENNSPLGILEIAKKCILKKDTHHKPKYSFQKNDEVWIVIDLDPDKFNSRENQIKEVREYCNAQTGWNVALSNPCFEVWLFYHLHKEIKKGIEYLSQCSAWKKETNSSIKGGFDSRKHPIFLEQAISNSKENHSTEEGLPNNGATEVHYLGESIFHVLHEKIKKAVQAIERAE